MTAEVDAVVSQAIQSPSLERQILMLRQQLDLQIAAANKMRGQYEAQRIADAKRRDVDMETMRNTILRLQRRLIAAGLAHD